MPNWVYNSIVIEGEKEDIAKLQQHLRHSKDGIKLSSFEKHPYPKTFLKYDTTNSPFGERLKKGKLSPLGDGRKVSATMIRNYVKASHYQEKHYGAVGWYDYNCLHFGCKWNSRIEESIEMYEDSLLFRVETPWSLPEAWLRRISEEWNVRVTDDYEEEANNYGPGTVAYEKGELVVDELKTTYIVDGETFDEDEKEDAIFALEKLTGLTIDKDTPDSELASEEFRDKVYAAVGDKCDYPWCILNPACC